MNPIAEKTEKEQLYIEYRDKVNGYVSGKIQNSHDAEDLVSEIFLNIYEKYDSYDKDLASVSTWIYTITRNTVIDYFRSRHISSELPEYLPDDSCPEEELLKKESLAELGKALSALDERSRGLIILRYYKKMTLKDTALKMGISYAYVKILHKNALHSLRKLMNQ